MNFTYIESEHEENYTGALKLTGSVRNDIALYYDGAEFDYMVADGTEYDIRDDRMHFWFLSVDGKFESLHSIMIAANKVFEHMWDECDIEFKQEQDYVDELKSPYLTGRI